MAERKNNYRGQYKVENGLDGSFESYWSRYGVESQDDSVRVLMHAIFDLLSQDIKKSQKSADYNQAIFDMVEMRDLQKALKQVLEQYSEIEESDLKMTTDVVRKRLQASIENEIKNVFDSVTKKLKEANAESEQANKESDTEAKVQEQQKPSRDELEKKIRDILGQFFESKKRESKTEEKKPETIPSAKSKEKKQENIQKEDVPGVKSQGANQDKVVKTEIVQEKTEPKKEKSEEDDLEKFSKALIREYWRGGNAAEKSSDPIFTKLGKKLRQKIATKGGLTKLLSKFTFGEQQKKSRRKGPFSKDKDNPLDSYSKLTGKLAKYMEKKEKNDKKRFKQKIQNGFKLLRASFSKALGFAFNMFKLVLTPIGNVMSGVWNTIRHPIQSLQKFLQSGVFGIIKATFSNPANAHLMGFILGFIYFRFIQKPLLKYIINPILRAKNAINEKRIELLRDKKELPIIKKMKDTIGKVIDFFRPVEGMNYIFGLIYKIAQLIKFPFHRELKEVFSLFCSTIMTSEFFSSIRKIIEMGMFSHFQGAGLIQKMVMLAVAQQGRLQAEVLEEGDEKYSFMATETLRKMGGNPESNIAKSETFRDLEKRPEAQEDFYASAYETYVALHELDTQIDFLARETEGLIGQADIEQFFESKMYSREALQGLFYKLTGGLSFEEYGAAHGKEEQLKILQQMKTIRGRMAFLKTAVYQSDAHTIDTFISKLGPIGKQKSYLLSEEPKVYIKESIQTVSGGAATTATSTSKSYEIVTEIDRKPRGWLDRTFGPKIYYKEIPLWQALQEQGGWNATGNVYIPFYPHSLAPTKIERPPPQGLIKPLNVDDKTSKLQQHFQINTNIPFLFQIQDLEYTQDLARYIQAYSKNESSQEIISLKTSNLAQISANNSFVQRVLEIAMDSQNELTNIFYVYDHDEDGVA